MGQCFAKSEVQNKKNRGYLSTRTGLQNCFQAQRFQELKHEGQGAFFWYLRGEEYPEDEEITKISAEAKGMDEDAQSFQLWVKLQSEGKEQEFPDDSKLSLDEHFKEFKKRLNEIYDESLQLYAGLKKS